MRYVATALVFLVFGVSSFSSQASSKSGKHPVEVLYFSGIDAFNEHDLDEFMEQFHDDMQMFNTSTGWLRNLEAIRGRFATIFQQFQSVRMVIEDFQVREVEPQTAVVDFRWTLYPTGSGPAYRGVASGVYAKREGKWGEVLEHETVTSIDEALQSPRN